MAREKTIAIVDDDMSVREATMALLKALGYPSVAFDSAEAFLRSETRKQTCFLIADVRMPGMNGLELYLRLAEDGAIPTVLVTAHADDSIRTRALAEGVVGYLTKPFAASDLVSCIKRALPPDAEGRDYN